MFEMSGVTAKVSNARAKMLDLADVMAVHLVVKELEMQCVLHLPHYQ